MTTEVYGGQLKLVTESQLKEIHQTAMDILSEVGVKVLSKSALEIFKAKGVLINDDTVRLSKELIEWAIETSPSYVLLAGQSEEFDLHLEKNRVYLGTGGAAINVHDIQTGQTRPATLPDLAKMEFPRFPPIMTPPSNLR